MQIEKNSIVSLHYIMKNDDGEIMEDITGNFPYEFLYGHGNLFAALEDAITGLSAGERKSFSISDKMLRGVFHFDVVIDDVRTATDEEIAKGRPVKIKDCGPDCKC